MCEYCKDGIKAKCPVCGKEICFTDHTAYLGEYQAEPHCLICGPQEELSVLNTWGDNGA